MFTFTEMVIGLNGNHMLPSSSDVSYLFKQSLKGQPKLYDLLTHIVQVKYELCKVAFLVEIERIQNIQMYNLSFAVVNTCLF